MIGRIVIGIPIKLRNRQEIASALLGRYGTDYLLSDRIFKHAVNNDSCEIDICDRSSKNNSVSYSKSDGINFLDNQDLNLAEAIELAGQNKITIATLEQINRHQQVVYLSSTEMGYKSCLKMALFTQVFLNIGGIAVQVKSAGIAHEASHWLTNYNSNDVFDIYSLFVGLVEAEDIYYSCGMHNFGKADVSIEISENLGLAIYVMNVFNYYRLTESPVLIDGHSFQPDIESPNYTIELIEDCEHELDNPLYNSYGRWHLSRS